MEKSSFYAILLSVLLIINVFSFSAYNSGSEPVVFNQTFGTITWTSIKYVASSETFDYENLTIVAAGIQVNGSGTLNLNNCTVYNTGNFFVNGLVNMIDTMLMMNCTTTGQYSIEVRASGNLNATNCTFTASDKTSINTYGTTPWLTSYGRKYRFTALSNSEMTLRDCDITHAWGNSNINLLQGGGVRLYSSDVLIDNCTIGENEIAGVFVFGSVSPVIKNSVIYNNTFTQMLTISFATPVADNNVFKNSPAVGGWGVYLYMDCEPEFTNNTIEHITWSGMVIQQHSNASVSGNTIRNCIEDGILVWGYPGNNGPMIDGNHIYNNSNGINLQPFDDTGQSLGTISGNISNNKIEKNNNSGIFANNFAATAGLGTKIDSILYNNTVTDNEAGVVIWECNPDLYYNDISKNNFTGLYVLENSDPEVMYNTMNDNQQFGIFINTTSEPNVAGNTIQNNGNAGILCIDAAPTLSRNNVSYNTGTGIFIDGQSKTFVIRTNNITKNGFDGISLNNSSPNIINNNLIQTNNNSGIGVYNYSNPKIEANRIINNYDHGILFLGTSGSLKNNNNISWNRKNGVACINNAAPNIGFSSIYQNMEAGVYSIGSNPRIVNCILDSNIKYGINTTMGSGDTLENSTIKNSGLYDYYITLDTHSTSKNSIYNKGSVYFGDSVSTLRGQWFFNINVTDTQNNALPGARLNITQGSSTGQVVWASSTDAAGRAHYVNITKYIQTQSGITNYGPHHVHADAFNYVPDSKGPYSGELSFWLDFSLLNNRAPVSGTFLAPLKTHDTSPTLTWSPGVDPEGQPLFYNIMVGTTPASSNTFFRTDLATNSVTLPAGSLSYDYGDGIETYYVTIEFDDRDGGKNSTEGQFNLTNDRPTRPYINLTPESPTIYDTITCWINETSIDIDTDPLDNVTYTFKWSINDVLKLTLQKNNTKDTSASIKSGDGGVIFKKHDIIKCSVVPYDGIMNGLGDMDTVRIINVKPGVIKPITPITVSEDTALPDIINLYDYFEDPDDYLGDPLTSTLDFRSSMSPNLTVSIDQDGTVDITPNANWHGVESIRFTAEDSDGETVFTDLKLTVEAVNDLPRLLTIGSKTVISDTILPFIVNENEQWFYLDVVASDQDIENGEDDMLFFDLLTDKDIFITPDAEDPLKARIAFYPDDDNIGTWQFDVRLRDSADLTWDSVVTVKFTVNNQNDNPVIVEVIQKDLDYNITFKASDRNKRVEFKNELSAVEGKWFNITIRWEDEDRGELFKYELDDKVRFAVNSNTGDDFSVELQFLPTKNDIGTQKVTFTLLDRDFAEDNLEIVINVRNVNDAPKALILRPNDKDQFLLGTEIFFQGDYIDADSTFGDKMSFQWASDKDGIFGEAKDVTAKNLRTGWHTISFTVTDSGGLSNTASIKLQIITPEDRDGDGLPDDWEVQYFGDWGDYGPGDDPDGDGYNNQKEYEEGTNPNDASSYPGSKKGEVDDTIVSVAIILSIVIIIIAVTVFGYLLKTQRKKEVVGWDWMTTQDKEVGPLETLPGYEAAQQVPPLAARQGEQIPPPGTGVPPQIPAPVGKVPGQLPPPSGRETENLVLRTSQPEGEEASGASEEAGEESGEEEEGEGEYECPECGATIGESDTKCSSCGVEFE